MPGECAIHQRRNRNQPRIAAAAHHHVVDGVPALPIHLHGQHCAALCLVVAADDLVQQPRQGICLAFRQKSDAPQVHAEQRRIPRKRILCAAKQRAVAAQRQNHIRPRIRRIQRSHAARRKRCQHLIFHQHLRAAGRKLCHCMMRRCHCIRPMTMNDDAKSHAVPSILIQSAVFFTNSTRSIPIITQDEYSCKHIQKF